MRVKLLFQAFTGVPDLIREIFTGKYALIAVLILIIYLVAILLSNNVTRIMREIIVLAAVAAGLIAYFRRYFRFVWLMIILLAVLFVVRFLCFTLVTIRVSRRNRRIERRALEKAAMRRGAWKNRRGYSGAPEPDDEPPVMGVMDSYEISDVLENETSDREGADLDLTVVHAEEPAEREAASAAEGGELSRAAVMDALRKLEDLRQIGIISEEEMAEKRAILYSRMR